MRKPFFLIIISVLISCQSYKKSIIGTYTSKKKTKLDRLFDSYDYWAIGSTLQLKKDSTFYMKNCGNILEGKWKKKNDSLLLFISSNKYVIDSLNEIPEWKEQLKINNDKPLFYIIKNKILYKKSVSRDDDGKYTSLLQKLKKQAF
jgi:hypothetical protein